jgi:hypothetical protein
LQQIAKKAHSSVNHCNEASMRALTYKTGPGFSFALLLSFAVTVGASSSAASTTSTDTPVLISLRVNAAYDDTQKSLDEIQEIVEFLPPTRISTAKTISMSEVVLGQYGFGPSNLPKTYALLARVIQRLNGIGDPAAIAPGTLLVPSIPRRALTKPRPENPYNHLPKTTALITLSSAQAANTDESTIPNLTLEDEKRKGASEVEITVQMPESSLRSKLESPIYRSDRLSVRSAVVELTLAAATVGAPLDLLTQSDRVAIQQSSTAATRNAYLFVLDSGWPTSERYHASLDIVEALFDEMRTSLGMPDAKRSSRAVWAEPVTKHCQHIETALSDLETLDTRRRVRIVYLPLTLDQSARAMLKELLEIAYIHDLLDETGAAPSTTNILLDDAHRYADGVINTLIAQSSGPKLITNKAIIEATYILADHAAKRDKTHYFLSESWTVNRDVLKFSTPSQPYGLTVVAAGNAQQNVNTATVDFAHRSLGSSNYVAVVNIDRDGKLLCDSSYVDEGHLDATFAVGFDGRIDGDCGTSFSAPRAAWFLALSDAATPSPSLIPFWASESFQRIRHLRSSGNGWSRIWLDPARLLTP